MGLLDQMDYSRTLSGIDLGAGDVIKDAVLARVLIVQSKSWNYRGVIQSSYVLHNQLHSRFEMKIHENQIFINLQGVHGTQIQVLNKLIRLGGIPRPKKEIYQDPRFTVHPTVFSENPYSS